MVPAWSLALAFVVGLAAGAVVCRLVMGGARSAGDAPALPEPAASPAPEPSAAPEPEPVAEAEGAAVAVAGEEKEGESEDPAAAVDDVVAELERRVKGRRADGETDRATGGRRGRRG
ncbi:MAG TPA: hypothetical protein VOB72_02910 [Candidatus Dormibacteraeota bacterium]|nr:hypothetical protein [Candidatus Dormibacteraeota bacterium]